MKYFLLTLITCLLFSCSKKNSLLGNFENRTDFLNHVEKLDDEKRKEFLQELNNSIEASLDETSNSQIYFSFGMGLSSGDEKEINWDTINWDNLDIKDNNFILQNSDTALADFEALKKNISYTQIFELPNSTFELESGLSMIINDVQVRKLEYYSNKQRIDSSQVKMQPISHIKANVSYNLIKNYDSLLVAFDSKEINFNGYQLDIDTISQQSIEIDIPIQLYVKYIENRGQTPNNRLISTNSYSSFPLWGFRIDYQEQCKSASQLFQEIISSPKTDNIMQKLNNKFDDNMFEALKNLDYYQSNILDNFEKIVNVKSESPFEIVNKLQEFIESNNEYIGPVAQRLTINYPYPVKNFVFYFSDSTENHQFEQLFPVRRNVDHEYFVFYDNDNKKYGISDSLGHIIIEPTYDRLIQSNIENYFFNTDDSTDYYLNLADKKLEPLKKGFRLIEKNKDISLYRDKKDKYGICKEDKEIIPFKYNMITLLENFILAKYKIRGRDIIDIYSYNGNLFKTNDVIREAHELENKYIMVRNNLHKYGIMNPKGELVVPLAYYELEKTFSSKYFYIPSNIKPYILSIGNKKIYFPDYIRFPNSHYIGDDLFGFYEYTVDDEYYGYFNEDGKIAIKPQYKSITPFKNGKAMVRTKNNDIHLIDKNNKTLKVIAKNFEDRISYDHTFDQTPVFVIGDHYYDLDGNITPEKPYKNY